MILGTGGEFVKYQTSLALKYQTSLATVTVAEVRGIKQEVT